MCVSVGNMFIQFVFRWSMLENALLICITELDLAVLTVYSYSMLYWDLMIGVKHSEVNPVRQRQICLTCRSCS